MILRLKSVLMVCGGHFHKVIIVLGAWPKAKAVLNVLTWLSCGCRPFFLGTWAAVLRRGQLSLLLPVSGHWKTIKALWTFGAYCILETTFSECSGSETMCTVIFLCQALRVNALLDDTNSNDFFYSHFILGTWGWNPTILGKCTFLVLPLLSC